MRYNLTFKKGKRKMKSMIYNEAVLLPSIGDEFSFEDNSLCTVKEIRHIIPNRVNNKEDMIGVIVYCK